MEACTLYERSRREITACSSSGQTGKTDSHQERMERKEERKKGRKELKVVSISRYIKIPVREQKYIFPVL